MIPVSTLSASDESEVGKLFRGQSMKFAGLTLRYDRGLQFKKLLSLQALRFQTYLAKNQNQIKALISISSGPRWIENKIQEVAFIGDFRIDNSREARRIWRNLLDIVVQKFDLEFPNNKPAYFFATILKGNKDAIKSFVPSRRDTEFKIKEIASVNMVNIFMRFRKFKTHKDYLVSRCDEADKTELFEFLKSCERKRELGFVFDLPEYCEGEFRRKNWGFAWSDFLILKKSGKIVACSLPWAPRDSIKSMSYSEAAKLLEGTLKILSYLGIKVPLRDQPIKTLYLTHLNISEEVDKESILSQLINFIYDNNLHQGYQMISFPDWWNLNSSAQVFSRTFHQKIEVGIYSIGIGGRKQFDTSHNKIYNFEMAVI